MTSDSNICYTIRRMTLNDVDGVHAIEAATFAKPWKREDFVKEMTTNTCARYVVAEAAGEIVGFAGAWIVLDEAHVTNIAVKQPYRGQGIGKALTEALLQYAANLGVVYATLEVRRSNEIAQNLYKALGFEYVGIRKRYYEDNGEDAFLFCCQHMPPADPDFEEAETVRE
ncbi:MAG: ribosomal protein S18-alanine N-acetyltransferase [Clostridia bacterium]|nr:ribosomal protein S18-alanine N-acetyltransferase [Clostridia bacterium]MBR0408157.1 ribosomal protein S18-alanine N-acetyltransferase [Clostridia bacterium]